jgi:hypothetical protein
MRPTTITNDIKARLKAADCQSRVEEEDGRNIDQVRCKPICRGETAICRRAII